MRNPEWPELLHDYIDAASKREFAYGAFDCALFCADWVQIATGVDYASGLRGYETQLQAYKLISEYGTVVEMVTHLLGVEPMPAAWAQRGDIVVIKNHPALDGAPEGLAICLGVHSAIPAATGLVMIRTLDSSAAWKVS